MRIQNPRTANPIRSKRWRDVVVLIVASALISGCSTFTSKKNMEDGFRSLYAVFESMDENVFSFKHSSEGLLSEFWSTAHDNSGGKWGSQMIFEGRAVAAGGEQLKSDFNSLLFSSELFQREDIYDGVEPSRFSHSEVLKEFKSLIYKYFELAYGYQHQQHEDVFRWLNSWEGGNGYSYLDAFGLTWEEIFRVMQQRKNMCYFMRDALDQWSSASDLVGKIAERCALEL